MSDLLEIEGLSVSFGGLSALDGVSVSVAPNQVLGVIGPNGAGKTTLFNSVCGFVKPAAGTLRWDGKPLPWPRPHRLARLGIARTLQALGLFPQLTVVENVMVGATAHARAGFAAGLLGLPRSDRDERALRDRSLAMLDELGVADTADRLPDELPYAARKQVALARALVGEPKLLLLDEPASGLSEEEMRRLGELIRSLRPRMSVMLVEHHMDLVMTVCDSITVLDFGQVIARGTPDEIRDDPLVLEAYLGDAVTDSDTVAEAAASGVPDA